MAASSSSSSGSMASLTSGHASSALGRNLPLYPKPKHGVAYFIPDFPCVYDSYADFKALFEEAFPDFVLVVLVYAGDSREEVLDNF